MKYLRKATHDDVYRGTASKVTDGTGFSGITLTTSLWRLIDVFGQPSRVGSGDN